LKTIQSPNLPGFQSNCVAWFSVIFQVPPIHEGPASQECLVDLPAWHPACMSCRLTALSLR
jgi:hypothetical protein